MKRILLLEPNHILGARYAEFLKKHGYTVDWSENGHVAIMYADAYCPDIIVMELLLAGHSGIEFLYEFRSYPEWSDVPIILLSRIPRAQLRVDDRVLKELGVQAYLYKPDTSLKRLHERIRALQDIPQTTT